MEADGEGCVDQQGEDQGEAGSVGFGPLEVECLHADGPFGLFIDKHGRLWRGDCREGTFVRVKPDFGDEKVVVDLEPATDSLLVGNMRAAIVRAIGQYDSYADKHFKEGKFDKATVNRNCANDLRLSINLTPLRATCGCAVGAMSCNH